MATVSSSPRQPHAVAILFNALVDPKSAAPGLFGRRAWILPTVIGGLLAFYVSISSLPFMLDAVRVALPERTGPEQAERILRSFSFYQHIGVYLSPFMIFFKWCFFSALVYISCVLLDIRVTYRTLFNIVSHCGLLLILQDLLVLAVLNLRHAPIQSASDLAVAFGLDLMIKSASPVVMAILSYFSVLKLWFLVSSGLAISEVGDVSRLRGMLAMVPLVALQVIFFSGLALLTK
jgi:hypothetical protein